MTIRPNENISNPLTVTVTRLTEILVTETFS